MKNFKFILTFTYLVLGLAILIFSCKKKNDTPITYVGTSVGTYDFTSDAIPFYLSFNLKVDNTVDVIAFNSASQQNVTGSGIYTLSANKAFDASITTTGNIISAQSFTGTFDPASGKLSGTWGFTPSKTNGGTWTMTKQ